MTLLDIKHVMDYIDKDLFVEIVASLIVLICVCFGLPLYIFRGCTFKRLGGKRSRLICMNRDKPRDCKQGLKLIQSPDKKVVEVWQVEGPCMLHTQLRFRLECSHTHLIYHANTSIPISVNGRSNTIVFDTITLSDKEHNIQSKQCSLSSSRDVEFTNTECSVTAKRPKRICMWNRVFTFCTSIFSRTDADQEFPNATNAFLLATIVATADEVIHMSL